MFMQCAAQRAVWRLSKAMSAAAIAGGFALATLIALIAFPPVADAGAQDARLLATMLVAPQLHVDAGGPARETLLALMTIALAAMTAGSLVFWRGLTRDLERSVARRR